MLNKLNHIAIAVPDLNAARTQYSNVFGVDVSDSKDLPDHGVTVVMVTLPNVRIELLHPLGENSPIQNFLRRNPLGGVHHMCFEVPNLLQARDQLIQNGIEAIGDGTPKTGYDGHPVLFFNPKNTQGTLIELKEVGFSHERQASIESLDQNINQDLEPTGGITISYEGDFVGSTPGKD